MDDSRLAEDTCQLPELPTILQAAIGRVKRGSFVEVGAFDGVRWSNTYRLAHMGWRGIYIEPQPEWAALCRENHRRHSGVFVEEVACGPYPGRTRLYLGGSLTTTDPVSVDMYVSAGMAYTGIGKESYIEVNVVTLDSILEKREFPLGFELLVIDTEGTELDVLRGFDIKKWKPKVVIIELRRDYPESLGWQTIPTEYYMMLNDYSVVYSDSLNTIWKFNRVPAHGKPEMPASLPRVREMPKHPQVEVRVRKENPVPPAPVRVRVRKEKPVRDSIKERPAPPPRKVIVPRADAIYEMTRAYQILGNEQLRKLFSKWLGEIGHLSLSPTEGVENKIRKRYAQMTAANILLEERGENAIELPDIKGFATVGKDQIERIRKAREEDRKDKRRKPVL